MGGYYASTDRKSQTCPVLFRGEEWIKYAVDLIRGDAWTGIRDLQLDHAILGRTYGCNVDGECAAFRHGFKSIANKVHDDSFKCPRIG